MIFKRIECVDDLSSSQDSSLCDLIFSLLECVSMKSWNIGEFENIIFWQQEISFDIPILFVIFCDKVLKVHKFFI